MRAKLKSKVVFYLDTELSKSGLIHNVEEYLKNEKFKITYEEKDLAKDLNEKNLTIIFTTPKKIKKSFWPRNKVFILPTSERIEGGSIIKCDFLNYQQVELTINLILEIERKLLLNIKLKESESLYEKIKNNNSIQNENVYLEILKDYELFLDLELDLLKCDSLKNWNNIFKLHLKKINWIQQLFIATYEELLNEDSVLDEQSLIYKLPFENFFIFIK